MEKLNLKKNAREYIIKISPAYESYNGISEK
jgi:hypothetical protein